MSADICNRCLIQLDARMETVARWKPDGFETLRRSDPAEIIHWYEAVMVKSGGDAVFSLGPQTSLMVPVSTWNGDPVCYPHLYEMRDRELKTPTGVRWR